MYRNWMIPKEPTISGCFVEGDAPDETAGGAAKPAEEKVFTQADVDRVAAESRRKGAEAERKKNAQAREELLAEFDTRTARIVTEAIGKAKPPETKVEPPVAAKPPETKTETPAAAKPPETKVDHNDPSIAEMRARQTKLEQELAEERKQRQKLQEGLTDEKKMMEQAKAEARKGQISEELINHLITTGKLTDRLARGAAKVMLAEDRISVVLNEKNGTHKAYWKLGELDDDGNEKTLPLKDGIALWAKSEEADQYRPPIVPGAGSSRSNAHPFGKPEQTDMSKMTEAERWSFAERQDKEKRRANRA